MTNASNAPHGCDPRVYPYWCVINRHQGRPDLYVFVARRGLNPLVLKVNKARGQVSLLRELPWAGVTSGEGSYFSDTDPAQLYFLDGPSLRREDVETSRIDTVFTLDARYGDNIWQAHSSADDTVHSATVRRRTGDGPYEKIGTVVYRAGKQIIFQAQGELDESQIDKSGRWLTIQEKVDGDPRDRIIDLLRGGERILHDSEGAVAHLDAGDGIIVGEDDRTGDNWRMRLWDLENGSTRILLEGTPPWRDGLGHVAIRGGRVLLSSNATGDLLEVPLGGADPLRVIAPGMLAVAPGMTGDDLYDRQLRACFDPLGEYACFISNTGDPYGRFDAFLVRVSTNAPPIIVRPPDPEPGGKLVPGSQPYPDEPTWWTEVLAEIGQAYEQQNRSFDLGMFKWSARIAYDIGIGMERERSRRKHVAEMMAELSGGTQ